MSTEVFPRRSFFGAGAGFGLRVRVVNRVSLFGEFTVGRMLQKNASYDYVEAGQEPLQDYRSYAVPVGWGLIYEFK